MNHFFVGKDLCSLSKLFISDYVKKYASPEVMDEKDEDNMSTSSESSLSDFSDDGDAAGMEL